MAFCHCLKMSWRMNGVSPRAEIDLGNLWHFTTIRKQAGERMAFRHELKTVFRVNSNSDFFFPLSKNHFQLFLLFSFSLFVLKIFFILNLPENLFPENRDVSFANFARLTIETVCRLYPEAFLFQKRFCFRNASVSEILAFFPCRKNFPLF